MTLHRYFRWLHNLCVPSARSTEKLEEFDEIEYHTTRPKEQGISGAIENSENIEDIVQRIVRQFEITDEDVRNAADGFVKQMNDGLCRNGCIIEQLPSFITDVPRGSEKGTCLAVDLGGTNIRVCSVTFHGDGTYTLVQSKVAIPTSLMVSKDSKGLFDWVAGRVQEFLGEHFPSDLLKAEMPAFNMGFTFSHAVQQLDINSGTLIRWSKGFDIDGVVGQDVCALLQRSFNELNVPVNVTALINDTVGTLLTHAYTSAQSGKTVLGAVFGTGTNGAYIEKSCKVTKLNVSGQDTQAIMIMNTEWGNFDQKLEYLPSTVYDNILDAASVNPGIEMFEKRISGMYLGEILRLVILSLYQEQRKSFLSQINIPTTSNLFLSGSMDTSFLSNLENDNTTDLSVSRKLIGNWIGIAHVGYDIANTFRSIARAIGKRSARLSAVALGAVVVHTECLTDEMRKEESVCIGVDGSLVELYPGFLAEMRRTLKCLDGIGEQGEVRIQIGFVKDGSGVGAALAAHVAARVSYH